MAKGILAHDDSLIGRTVGHYRVEERIGRGGMGAVYRAWDLSLERPVALKTVLIDNPHTRMLFGREARTQAKLRHANVVPVHFIGEHEGLTYLVMELVEGESLAAELERVGRLPEDRALEIIDAIAAALEFGHSEGLLHRDIKPSNVLVERGGRVLLADFGLAKVIGPREATTESSESDKGGAEGDTNTKGAIGTPAYIAPELTHPGQPVDHRADIYSLGVTFYELVTGTRPFNAPTSSRLAMAHERAPVIAPRIIEPRLGEGTEAIILRMLEKLPALRYPDYAELRRALAAVRAPSVPAALFPRASAFLFDLAPVLLLQAAFMWPFDRGASRIFIGLATSPWWLPVTLLFAYLESRHGATWGKRIVGIYTVAEGGHRLGFGSAFVRTFIKFHGPIQTALMGVGLAFLPAKAGKAALRPETVPFLLWMIAGFLVFWSLSMLTIFGKRRAPVHDRVVTSRVIVDLRKS